ncbi:MAG: hypothetical protein IT244_10180 [Bacteroidia bacterium]|nr:hypothetical protein [Bacteroidia bacterium]
MKIYAVLISISSITLSALSCSPSAGHTTLHQEDTNALVMQYANRATILHHTRFFYRDSSVKDSIFWYVDAVKQLNPSAFHHIANCASVLTKMKEFKRVVSYTQGYDSVLEILFLGGYSKYAIGDSTYVKDMCYFCSRSEEIIAQNKTYLWRQLVAATSYCKDLEESYRIIDKLNERISNDQKFQRSEFKIDANDKIVSFR